MAFDTLLGNDRLKQNLAESLAKNRISHFYLISGPAGSGKRTLAKLLSAAILCKGSHKPCGVCESCRKLRSDNHPDVITVTDPEHKNIAVKIVRQVREDVFIRPNESDYKIYIFAQDLGTEGQNALLKILEEPPKHGIFLLLTDNPGKILPTVRSRCTELKLQALPEEVLTAALRKEFPQASREDIQAAVVRSGALLGQAQQLLRNGEGIPPQTEQFVEGVAARNALVLTQLFASMEKWKRDPLAGILQSWLELAEEALACRMGLQAVSPLSRKLSQSCTAMQLHDVVAALKKAADYTSANVSPAAVCGWLAWELR
ncbi:MAG: DNA polymerase III subunit [Oscillospiraceae bacterium]|nr:DNA polymerase III subunit [Oscillospiraceae bacterium]